MSPQNPQSGAEELAIPEQKEAVDSVGNLADLVTEIKPPLEIKDEDRSKIEAAFGGQKIDKDTIVGLSYDEMVDAEKKENGSLSVLFGKKYDQEKGYTGMALKDKESYKEGDKVLVHFQGNETAYWEIGAGDMLPENVREVKISDSEGNSRIGKRKGLKCGFYDSKGYIPVFDNYTIEVTEVWDKEKMARQIPHLSTDSEYDIVIGQIQCVKKDAVCNILTPKNKLWEPWVSYSFGSALIRKQVFDKFFFPGFTTSIYPLTTFILQAGRTDWITISSYSSLFAYKGFDNVHSVFCIKCLEHKCRINYLSQEST